MNEGPGGAQVTKEERDYLRAIEKLVGNKLASRPAGEFEADDHGSPRPHRRGDLRSGAGWGQDQSALAFRDDWIGRAAGRAVAA